MVMQTPAQIEFDGVEASPELQAAIDQHIAELESHFGRVTAGRVVVRGPGHRHQTGGQYHVSVRLALPDGRQAGRGLSANQVAAHRYVEEGTPSLLDRRAGNGNPKVDELFLKRLRYLLCFTPGQFG